MFFALIELNTLAVGGIGALYSTEIRIENMKSRFCSDNRNANGYAIVCHILFSRAIIIIFYAIL